MARRSSVNSSLISDPNEEAIEKHKDYRKIGAAKYGRIRVHRLSRVMGDPEVEEALKFAPARGKIEISEEQPKEPEDNMMAIKNQLSEIEVVAIATVLESIVDMLYILSVTNDKPDVEPTITYLTLDERFGELQSDDVIMNPDKPRNLDSKYELYRKMQSERASFESTLVQTIHDLVTFGSYKPLEDYVIYKMFVTYEEDQLQLQVKLNENSVTDLKEKFDKQMNFMETLAEELDKKVADIKDKMYEISVTNGIRQRYATKWEKSRGEQHHYALVHHEANLKKRVKDAKLGVDNEVHANHQILTFIGLDIEQLTGDVKTWAEKSFEDLEEIDLQTQKKKTVYNYVLKEVEEAQELLRKRHTKIVQTLVRRILPLHTFVTCTRRDHAAKKIQRWWRSILMARKVKATLRETKKKGAAKEMKNKIV